MEQSAQKLAKNPLGIIALFIVLVYAIAALVLGVFGSSLSENERFPLILFMVLFPILVLGVFAWLVKDHHTKLYAPSDFETEEGFFRAKGLNKQLEVIDEKIEDLEKEESVNTQKASNINIAGNIINWEPANARKELFLAESLVFRELESKYKTDISRQASLGDYEFDGFFTLNGAGTGVEIKFTKSKSWINISDIVLRKAMLFKESVRSKRFKLVLAVVAVGLTDAEFNNAKNELATHLDNAEVPVHFKPYSFEKLVEKYGMSENI